MLPEIMLMANDAAVIGGMFTPGEAILGSHTIHGSSSFGNHKSEKLRHTEKGSLKTPVWGAIFDVFVCAVFPHCQRLWRFSVELMCCKRPHCAHCALKYPGLTCHVKQACIDRST